MSGIETTALLQGHHPVALIPLRGCASWSASKSGSRPGEAFGDGKGLPIIKVLLSGVGSRWCRMRIPDETRDQLAV
ncbi:hypothetical protein, partial [Streptomyces sp. NPDC000351]|uniref:hypothetical protein n=1 Tax=Streptomyces sp. NPDC000351 TaxID=3154250 RepID=UPI00332E9BBF